ncbi:hypothetical protein [Streptomyces sp. MNP-20]|uniref:hypothetical protein n=1 Tax=Streptomyces sp. MNP-20 TaxID=2721165 RepID=UPI0015581A45|nr:hypothetical protein [Streptomyces sp. MNP-20]
MINDYRTMQNCNQNLFAVDPEADALDEYDSDAARPIRLAARHLNKARSTGDREMLERADVLTRQAAGELLISAGRSVQVRFPLMLTARLVELEAALLELDAPAAPAAEQEPTP